MNDATEDYLYILGDGDGIRDRVECMMLSGNIRGLSDFSRQLVNAIEELRSQAARLMDAEIIMAGGDDLFIRVHRNNYHRNHVERLALLFREMTGSSFSFGVGIKIETAYINLRKAKVSQSSLIVE